MEGKKSTYAVVWLMLGLGGTDWLCEDRSVNAKRWSIGKSGGTEVGQSDHHKRSSGNSHAVNGSF